MARIAKKKLRFLGLGKNKANKKQQMKPLPMSLMK